MHDQRADLHTHTTASDGVLAPGALVERARAAGLTGLAVTDHDTLDGLDEALAAGADLGVDVVPGVELSVTVGTVSVHLLGYGFDPAHPTLQQFLAQFRAWRAARARAIVERLQDLGLALTFEDVEAEAGAAVLTRPHIARALVAAGHAESVADAFEQYLRDDGPAGVPAAPVPASKALQVLHEAGGLGVLAHPGHWTTDRTVMTLVRWGLDGIETVHPAHDAMLTTYYRGLARDFALLETGGSDYHGARPDEQERLGQYTVPYATLKRLRRRTAA